VAERQDAQQLFVYWGNRQETLTDCAQRAFALLQGLASLDPIFTRWYEPSRGALDIFKREIPRDLPTLEQLLRRGRDHLFASLGFHHGLSTAERPDGPSGHIRFMCGGYQTSPRVPTVNLISFGLPPLERLHHPDLFAQIFALLASTWAPDWGVVHPVWYRRDTHQTAGWLTYVAAPPDALPALPDAARLLPIGHFGTLVIASERPLVRGDLTQHAALNRLRDALLHAGHLRSRNA
jgi:hypothetical protein